MKIPFFESPQFSAINIDINGSKVRVGILCLEPKAPEQLSINGQSFYLTDDLINQPKLTIALENEFELANSVD